MSASNRSQSPSAGAGMWKKVALVIAVLAIAVAAVVLGWQALSDDGTEQASPRTPDAAPSVLLSSVDQEVWVPGPADRSQIPVLLYHGIAFPGDFSNTEDSAYGVDPDEFAKQMVLLAPRSTRRSLSTSSCASIAGRTSASHPIRCC